MARAEWNPENPLAPIDGETDKANQGLHDYALMGRHRALKKLAEKYEEDERRRARGDTSVPDPPTLSEYTINNWSAKYDWQNRVLQWEMLQRERDEELWQQRRDQVRDDDWTHATKLRNLALRIIDAAPAFINRTRKVVDEGKPEIRDLTGEVLEKGRPREIVVTVALSVTDLARIEKLAHKLARLAAEMDEVGRRPSADWRKEAEQAGISSAEAFETLVKSYVANISRGDGADDGGGAEGSPTPDGDK